MKAIFVFSQSVESFGIFIFKDWVLLLTDSDIPIMDEKRFSKIDSLNTFVLRVLSYAIFHFNEHLKIINRINDELEQKLRTAMENKYLLSMFSLNKGLIYYVSALNSNDTLLKKLQIGRSLNWSENERELLDDIVIENRQSLQQAEIYANILTSMMDARASVISNNVNTLMKRPWRRTYPWRSWPERQPGSYPGSKYGSSSCCLRLRWGWCR